MAGNEGNGSIGILEGNFDLSEQCCSSVVCRLSALAFSGILWEHQIQDPYQRHFEFSFLQVGPRNLSSRWSIFLVILVTAFFSFIIFHWSIIAFQSWVSFYFTHGNAYVWMLLSQFILPLHPLLCLQVHSWCLHLCFCPANQYHFSRSHTLALICL